MSRMIDLIRQSQAPANVMRAASKGALNLPAGEMIEILVYLTTNPLFAEQAKMTLAGWDEASSIAACQDANTPRAVLDYFVSPDNHRPKLIPALLDNPAVPEAALMEMAQTASRELVDSMLASARVQKSPHILHSLGTNIHLTPEEGDRLKAVLQARKGRRNTSWSMPPRSPPRRARPSSWWAARCTTRTAWPPLPLCRSRPRPSLHPPPRPRPCRLPPWMRRRSRCARPKPAPASVSPPCRRSRA
jgi:hypothetical protein